MIIQIECDDIIHGKASSCRKCPVATAINRVLRDPFVADITIPFATIVDSKTGVMDLVRRINLPDRVGEFIYQFDNHCDVFAFDFEIEIPDQYLLIPLKQICGGCDVMVYRADMIFHGGGLQCKECYESGKGFIPALGGPNDYG